MDELVHRYVMYRWQCVNVTTDGATPELYPLDVCFKDDLGWGSAR
jgi:hypothetical protein